MSSRKASGTSPDAAEGTGHSLRTPVGYQRALFLKRCRTRLDPADVGLPEAKRKRTKGLRREDVAALSGVGVSWYTWLEQGRTMRVSEEVLERISSTLKLSEDERVYLFSLVQQRAPRLKGSGRPQVPPEVIRTINALAVPAVVLDLLLNVLAWNRLSSLLYFDYGLVPEAERNLLEILLTRSVQNQQPSYLENSARRLIARLRFEYSKNADDPRFESLIHHLDSRSPVFRRLWRIPDFNLGSYGLHRFRHAQFGDLEFEHTSSVLDGYPHIRVVLCTPYDDAARRAVARANAELAAGRPQGV